MNTIPLLHIFTARKTGREKTLFSLAVNLLDIKDIQEVLNEGCRLATDMSTKDKAKYVSNRLREIANTRGIVHKLRKKKT